MHDRIIDRRRLKATVKHAVGALGIATIPIIFPFRLFQKGFETWGSPFLGQQITRPLPAEDIPRWVPPWGARVGLITR